MSKTKRLQLVQPWSVHTVNLLKEILNNNKTLWILRQPIQIFANLLYDVAERARELNDPKLTALMYKLTLYEQADPENPNYIGHEELKKIYDKGGMKDIPITKG